MSNPIRTLAGMIMNRVELKLAVDAERQHGKLDRAISELATALRGDAQITDKKHHPKPTNQG